MAMRVVALWLACAMLGNAQHYSFKHYLQDRGLTNLAVNTINQDQDGFLWVATDNGLFRYNGQRFYHFGREEGLPQDDVIALAVSEAGTVWAATPIGVAYLSQGRFHPVESGPKIWRQGRLTEAHGDATYASTGHGLFKFTRQGTGVSVDQLFLGETFGLATEPGGTVWFGCGQDLCRLQNRLVSAVGLELGLPHDQWESIVSGHSGELWVRSATHLYLLARGASRFVERDHGLPMSPGGVSQMRADIIYGITVPTAEGLAIPKGDAWQIIGTRNGLASNSIAMAFRDREGSMWIAVRGLGVDRWKGEGQWVNWTQAEGLSSDLMWGLAKDASGKIWAGNSQGVSMIDPVTGSVQNWGGAGPIARNRVLTVAADPKGKIWIAGAKGGLARLDPETSHRRNFGRTDGLPLESLRRILLDRTNTLWIFGAGGVYRSSEVLHDPIRFTRVSIPGTLPNQIFNNGVVDDDGCIWITSERGLYRYDGREWYRYGLPDGLKNESIGAITFSKGSVWLAYRSPLGITVINDPHGHWSTKELNTTSGLPSNMIYSLDAKAGSVWAGTDSGILQFHGTTWTNYSQVDGMGWDDCDTNGILAEESGVWIGTSGGLSHFTDTRTTMGRTPLAPFLKFVGQANRDDSAQIVVFPWSSRNFSIAWDSVNYRDEERAGYEYRLGGADSPWVSTIGMETSFSDLPAGSYVFEAHATGTKGAKSPDAKLSFRIAAPWWQTLQFRLAVALTLCGLAILIWRSYSARLLREKQKLELAVTLRTQELAQEKLRAEAERERAEAASRHKSDFLANMSHEIRTPMNGIIGMTDLLLLTTLSHEQMDLAHTVRECGEHLLSVINDVLDYSKIEAGFVTLEALPFDLRAAISLIADMTRPQIKSKGLALQLEFEESMPSLFVGDPGRVRQILMNFVSNAMKFTERGTIRIQVKRIGTGRPHEMVRIEVSDTGCGIAADKIGSLFQQFVQADASTTRRYGGTGLGLAISRRLAEMMGGSVGLESKVGEGSSFWAELQLCPAQAQVSEEKPKHLPVDSLDKRLKVLVAEDNVVNQKLITRMLERLGCDFELACDGLQAVDLYSKKSFDLVLMDCQMPLLDGYEATGAIRKKEDEFAFTRVPIIALTAHAGSGDRDRCLKAGMDLHLTKPISLERLRQILTEISRNSDVRCLI